MNGSANPARIRNPLIFAASHFLTIFYGIAATAGLTFAQDYSGSNPNNGAACAACGGCSLVAILIPVTILALNIALLVWVARDAKARGMDNSVLWMVLVMVLSLLGLLIYLLSRPKGELVPCPSCQNKRLQASAKCPHCGNA